MDGLLGRSLTKEPTNNQMVKAFPQIIPVMAPYLLEVVVKNPSKNTAKMGPANTPMAVLPSWRTPSRFVVIIASLQTNSNQLIH